MKTRFVQKHVVLAFVLLCIGAVVWAQRGTEDNVREIGSLRRGEFATIRGEVVRYRDYDEILIADASGRIEVYLGEPTASRWPFSVGDIITITGRVDDDLIGFRKDFYATKAILEDGTVLSVRSTGEWD